MIKDYMLENGTKYDYVASLKIQIFSGGKAGVHHGVVYQKMCGKIRSRDQENFGT